MRHNVHSRAPRWRQGGAMLVTVALVMFLLLGFIGVALDFGRLFVTKSELQTAMDSCALSAAQELDAQSDALVRARNAGKSASDLNRVGFQSATWGGLGLLDASTEITFRDTNYSATTTPASAVYAQCQHTVTGTRGWLMQALGAFGGNSALAATTHNVYALAVATRGSAQSTCPVPIALRPRTSNCAGGNCGAPNYGYTPGEWVTLLTKNDTGAPGYMGWANLDGSNSASETTNEMNGHCGVTVGTNLGTPGAQSSIVDNWNWRFGIYKQNQNPYDQYKQPDRSGYIYDASTWPSQSHAYDSPTAPAGAPAGAANFQTMRNNRANCILSTTVNNQSLGACATLTGLRFNSFKSLIEGGTSSTTGHARWGGNRRIVLVPVANGYPGSVQDFVCMLMLQPLQNGLPANVQLEFIGNAAAVGSPCSTSGLPGGVAGPLVPVLVR